MRCREYPGVLFLAVMILIVQAASAQPVAPAESSEAVFAPFPSHLRAATKGGSLVLSWTDSTDVQGRYAIYRSTQGFEAASFDESTKIAEVSSGVERFEDPSPPKGSYYYLVLALAEDGSPYRIFIQARNATVSPIAVERPASSLPSAADQPSPIALGGSVAPSLLPAVDAINAQIQGDAIVLRYRTLRPRMRLVLYRGTAPLQLGRDLLEASLVAAYDDKDGSFADYPVPGVDYWYAVLAENDLKAGHIDLRSGQNSTIQAARISALLPPAGFIEPSPMRTPPLPSIFLEKSTGSEAGRLPHSAEVPPPGALSQEGEKSTAAILKLAPPIRLALPAIHLLKEEQTAPTGGEDYALSLIISEKLSKEDWSGAADQLRKYLSLNRSPTAVVRARFYLGISLAESGQYREAFFEFTSARAGLPVETRPWIDYILFMLRQG